MTPQKANLRNYRQIRLITFCHQTAGEHLFENQLPISGCRVIILKFRVEFFQLRWQSEYEWAFRLPLLWSPYWLCRSWICCTEWLQYPFIHLLPASWR